MGHTCIRWLYIVHVVIHVHVHVVMVHCVHMICVCDSKWVIHVLGGYTCICSNGTYMYDTCMCM